MVSMKIKEAKEIVSISTRNSKMPGTTYSQDSFACVVGSKLAEIKGSVCNKCYARRIQKMRPSVNKGWSNAFSNWLKYKENPSIWEKAIVTLIERYSNGFHRWFDSGDLESIEQLKAIVSVAQQTPDIRHWLPTREIGIVREYLSQNESFPGNLCVRVSAPMIDQKPVSGFPHVSTVHTKGNEQGNICLAYTRGNNCGECRICWDTSIYHVSYKAH